MRSRYDRLVLRRIALRAGFVLSPEYHVGRGSLSSEPWNKCGRLSKTKERIRFIPFFEAFLCPFLLGWHSTPADACTLFVISGRSYFIVFAFFTVLFYRQMLVCQVGKQTKVNIVINRLVGKYSLKAIEQGIITDFTKDRLNGLQAELNDLEIEINKAAQKSYAHLSIEEVEKFLLSKVFEDPDDIKIRKLLVNTFVREVIWYGDHMVFTYNFQERFSTEHFSKSYV